MVLPEQGLFAKFDQPMLLSRVSSEDSERNRNLTPSLRSDK
jgi:hypothetical protein